ncbi:MAG: four helix bundle protein [Luteibaculaceae bacterium]
MDYKDLNVWKKAIELTKEAYQFTSKLPTEERFGLFSQIRRSAVSVPSNIAEGSARKSNKEFIQFCYISLGSLAELETQIILAKDLFKIDDNIVLTKLVDCRKLLVGMIRHLNK